MTAKIAYTYACDHCCDWAGVDNLNGYLAHFDTPQHRTAVAKVWGLDHHPKDCLYPAGCTGCREVPMTEQVAV